MARFDISPRYPNFKFSVWYNKFSCAILRFVRQYGDRGAVVARLVVAQKVEGSNPSGHPKRTGHSLAGFCFQYYMELTSRHVREHLGVETQRQRLDKATACTTPGLWDLFSFVTLLADTLSFCQEPIVRSVA